MTTQTKYAPGVWVEFKDEHGLRWGRIEKTLDNRTVLVATFYARKIRTLRVLEPNEVPLDDTTV